MISEHLIRHAQSNVWCEPFQDKQSILKLTRITRRGGDLYTTRVSWDLIQLPDTRNYYHVYQIGGNSPNRLSWPITRGRWVELKYWSETNRQVIDLYMNNGKHIPLTESYLMRTEEDNYIIAIKFNRGAISDSYQVDNWTWDIEKYPPMLRCYRNAYFEDKVSEYKVICGGGIIRSNDEKIKVCNEILLLKKEKGLVNIFHNGDLVSSIKPDQIGDKDYVEYTYDSSIIRIVDFKVNKLPDFHSEMDKVRKYLLHPPKNDDTTIRYRDDVDVYLYKKLPDGRLLGRYYHRYDEKSLRMVTHFDYSIPTAHVNRYVSDLDDPWAKYEDIYIRLHIRESGLNRPLVYETNRIHELYRLKDTEILDAMLGPNAVLDEWKVNTLESSMYTWIMRQWDPWLTVDQVLDAYGYNAASKLIANTPMRVTKAPNGDYVDLGVGLISNSTIFEYTEEGELINYYQHQRSERYYTRNKDCEIVEAFVGLGQFEIDWLEGNNDYPTDDQYTLRFYFCPKVKDKPTKEWVDATLGKQYIIDNGVVKWIFDKNAYQGLIVTDRTFLCYTFKDKKETNLYRFSIIHQELGNIYSFQPERFDLFINNRFAIPGLHYIIQWPEIMIVNSEYLVDGDNEFTYRCIGLPSDLSVVSDSLDTGFVEHGLVSLDGHYQTRDDKVITSYLNGCLVLNEEIDFAEDHDAKKGKHVNGQAYSIKKVPVPIREIPNERYWELREKAEDTDARLEDYLTLKYPQPKFDTPSDILKKHFMFSPMMVQVVYDIDQGFLIPPFEPDDYTEVNEKMQPYLFMLPYEPARQDINTNYVELVAHPYDHLIKVGVRTYRFLESINRFYLGNKLDISHFYQIEGAI